MQQNSLKANIINCKYLCGDELSMSRSKLEKGWFSERCDMWQGISLSLEIKKVLYEKKSKYQEIGLYQTKEFGKMLVLDGIIQLTQADEFAYHEMLAHLPLFAHPSPENMLVIGGGDGGLLREVARHDCVKYIDICEIDKDVIKVSKKLLPDIASGFDDKRVKVNILDANVFIKKMKKKYDIIIVDSSDPIGPGSVLFRYEFYKDLKAALKKNGIIATQGESFFLHENIVADLIKITRKLFYRQAYAQIFTPTYPGGNICVCMGSLGPKLTKPARKISKKMQKQLKYYSPKIHKSSFVLPFFAQKISDSVKV